MAEYIEKAALMSLIESEVRRWGDDYDYWQCLADIEDFKPADVRPVVRGKWKITSIYIKCLECGECFMLIPQNFCPNCGADMRETEE